MPSPIGTIAKQTGIIRLLTVDFSVWWGPIAARTVKYRCVHSWAQTPSKWFPDSGGRKFSRSPRNSIKGGEYRKEAEPTGILSLQRPDTSIPQPRINLCNMRSFRGKGFERSASSCKTALGQVRPFKMSNEVLAFGKTGLYGTFLEHSTFFKYSNHFYLFVSVFLFLY